MTATVDFALVVFGLAMLFWAITATDKSAGRRAFGASVGIIALLLALLLRADEDHHDWRDRS
jgi:hypothetical protein